MTTRAAVVQGVGGCVPPRSVDNEELSTRLNTSDAWIRDRLGIARRHVADGMSTVDLAVRAGARALEMADAAEAARDVSGGGADRGGGSGSGLNTGSDTGTGSGSDTGTDSGFGKLDTVVLATTTPDRLCPASAPEVAARLGHIGIAAFDVNAVCAGFVHALATGCALIRGLMAERVLVIGADVFTTLVDPRDRLTASIFGDGAGALVLRAGSPAEPGAVQAFDLGSDGSQVAAVEVPGGGARDRLGMPVANQRPYLLMDGPAVFERAVREMTSSSRRVLEKSGWEAESVRRFVPHQANIRIINGVAERLGIGAERVVANIEDVGNTVAASIPLALADAHDAGLMTAGDRVLLTSIGAGLAWGSAVLTWPELAGKARI